MCLAQESRVLDFLLALHLRLARKPSALQSAQLQTAFSKPWSGLLY